MGPFLQVGGVWDIVQSNGFRVRIDVRQEGERISAAASHSNGKVQSLSAEGNVSGPEFKITINWNNNTRGEYTGTLTRGHFDQPGQGFLKGRTRDLNNPGSQADWTSEGKIFFFA